MLIVSNLQGNSELLLDIQETTIRQRINENYELSFTAIKKNNNQYAYDLLQDEASVTLGNENFIIKSVQELPFSKSIIAIHEFFELNDDYVEVELSEGFYSIEQALNHAFSSTTDWNFEVIGSFNQSYLRGFGNNNPIALLNSILENFIAEYEFSSIDKRVRIYNSIGKVTDEQVRFKHNLSSIERKVDSNNVKTAIKAYYNKDDFGGYSNVVIYRSPLENQYRRTKWAAPIYLDDVTTEQEAIDRARNQLQDKPIVSIDLSLVNVKQSGFNSNNVELGDSFFLIDERLNLQDQVRIIEMETYPLDSSRSPSLVISNARKNLENLSLGQVISQQNLNNIAIKETNIYNGASITETDGILIRRRNGVVIRLNADIGFLIENGGKQELYIDTEGNVNFDGRLNITENGQTLLEAYQDDLGGLLVMNDINGSRNLRLGAANNSGNTGGVLELSTNGTVNASLTSVNENLGGELRLFGGSNIVLTTGSGIVESASLNLGTKTVIGENTGRINNSLIITQEILDRILEDYVRQ